MIKSIDEYLNALKSALAGSDNATIQDALADAEEHLRTAIESGLSESDKVLEEDILAEVIEKYGTPDEIAAAYEDMEEKIYPPLTRKKLVKERSAFSRFFGIFADPRAWGALMYMLFALVTGIVYFTWTVTGISTGLGMIFLIIGIPIIILFLYSIKGIAFIEGRIVEALLGERMPRRSRYTNTNVTIWERIKNLLKDRTTWIGMLYMVIQLPLGIFYFTFVTTLIATSIGLIFAPIAQLLFNANMIHIDGYWYGPPDWTLPLITIGGMLLLTVVMHISKAIGKLHGKWAKLMLVND